MFVYVMFTAPVSRYMRNKKSNVNWSPSFCWIFNAVCWKEKHKHSTFPIACLPCPLLIFSWERWVSNLVTASAHLLQDLPFPSLGFLSVSSNWIYFILATSEQTCVYIFSGQLDCLYRFLNHFSNHDQKYVNCCVVLSGSWKTQTSNADHPVLESDL